MGMTSGRGCFVLGTEPMSHRKSSARKWILVSCLFLLSSCVGVVILGFRNARSASSPRMKLEALLAGSEFHSDPSGKAFDEYAAAAILLVENGWTREKMKECLGKDAILPKGDSFTVVNDAANRTIRGATFRDAGLPRMPMLRDTTPVGSESLDIRALILPPSAALVIAQSRLRAGDQDDAVRFARAALAVGLHLMLSENCIVGAGGGLCAHRAINFLRDMAMDQGDAASVETYSAALIAFAEEFRAMKQSWEKKVGFRELLDIARRP